MDHMGPMSNPKSLWTVGVGTRFTNPDYFLLLPSVLTDLCYLPCMLLGGAEP